MRDVLVLAADDLGQAPVEHHHLAEAAEDDVVRLQVAVDDAVRVGVVEGLADADEGLQQFRAGQRVFTPLLAAPVVLADGLAQRLAADEAHGVERRPAFFGAAEFVDRHDVGVLKLPGDLRLREEAPPHLRVGSALGPDLLEGDVPLQVVVARDPDLAEAALAVQARQGVARALLGRLVHRLRQPVADGRRQRADGLAQLLVIQCADHVANGAAGDLGQRGSRVAAVLLQFAADEALDLLAVVAAEPAEFLEDVGQRGVLAGGPRRTGLGEAAVVDQFELQREHAEEEVAIRAERLLRVGRCVAHGRALADGRWSSSSRPAECTLAGGQTQRFSDCRPSGRRPDFSGAGAATPAPSQELRSSRHDARPRRAVRSPAQPDDDLHVLAQRVEEPKEPVGGEAIGGRNSR